MRATELFEEAQATEIEAIKATEKGKRSRMYAAYLRERAAELYAQAAAAYEAERRAA